MSSASRHYGMPPPGVGAFYVYFDNDFYVPFLGCLYLFIDTENNNQLGSKQKVMRGVPAWRYMT